jgi:predicted AAA+ superfamily ATPase
MTENDNPFADERLERLDFRMPTGVTWESFLKRCADNNYRGAIVGPMGSGKSVLLAQLAPKLVELGFNPRFFHLSPDSRRAEKDAVIAETKRMRAPDILLLDGAEQLQTRDWLFVRTVIDGLSGCIITLHRTGRLPTLIETGTSAALLEELALDLTGGRLPLGEAAAIYARGRGNIRECFRELHDRWAGE